MTIHDHEDDPESDSHAVDGAGSDGQRAGANSSYRLYGFDGCTPSAQSAAGQPVTYCTGFLVPDGVVVSSIGYSVTGVDIGAPDDLVWSLP